LINPTPLYARLAEWKCYELDPMGFGFVAKKFHKMIKKLKQYTTHLNNGWLGSASEDDTNGNKETKTRVN
jgi:hypothetical protein